MKEEHLESFKAYTKTKGGALSVLQLGVAAAEGDSVGVAKTAAAIAVGVTAGALAGPFVASAAGVAAIAATANIAAGVFMETPTVTEWFRDNLKSIDDKVNDASDWLGDQWDWVTEEAANVWENTKDVEVPDWAQTAADAVQDMVQSAWNYWTDDFVDDVRDFFNRGQSHASPIILDLDGDGIETVGLEAGVQFDHNGDGFAQATGWVGGDDALLAMDLSGNDEIEDGSELFGNASEVADGVTAMNGFEALAIHDSNDNGRIDPGDEALGDLRLWQDANGNGIVDDGEMRTLDEVGIGSIDLGYSGSNFVDEHDNQHRQVGWFEWADGREGEATDVWLTEGGTLAEVDMRRAA
jgi:hypothetical protein